MTLEQTSWLSQALCVLQTVLLMIGGPTCTVVCEVQLMICHCNVCTSTPVRQRAVRTNGCRR